MHRRTLFCVSLSLIMGSVLCSGCSDDFDLADIPESSYDDPEHPLGVPDDSAPAPKAPAVPNDSAGELTRPSAVAKGNKDMGARGAAEGGEWSEPNGTYHEVLLIDMSGSLAEKERYLCVDMMQHRIEIMQGSNRITVYLVGASYVRWPTAASPDERAALAGSVRDYLKTHDFTDAERAHTNYELPLLDAMEDGFRELKEFGTRFHATVVGDGWNEGPIGQDSEFIKRQIQELSFRLPAERKRMFEVELISVRTRGENPNYAGEEHLRDVFGDSEFPVYPAGNWGDVSKRFDEIDRELAGAYSWVNVRASTSVRVSDFGDHYRAGVYVFSLDAPFRGAGEFFTARLVADSEQSVRAAHVLGFWKIRGSRAEPTPFSEPLAIPDGAEVLIYVGLNEENPPPDPAFWPVGFEVLCEVELLPHSAVSLTERGNRLLLQVSRRAWVFRNWIPNKLIGVVAMLAAFAVAVRFLSRRLEREWGPSGRGVEGGDPFSEPAVGFIECDGHQYPIGREWFGVRNLDVVPTPDGIRIRPRVPASMVSLSRDGAAAPQAIEPGETVPLSSDSVEIRDVANVVYQVSVIQGSEDHEGQEPQPLTLSSLREV